MDISNRDPMDDKKEQDFGDLRRSAPKEEETTSEEVRMLMNDAMISLRAISDWVVARNDFLLSREYMELVHRMAVVAALCMNATIRDLGDDDES